MLLIEFLGLLPLRAGRHVRGLTSGSLSKQFFGSISRQSDVLSDKKTIILGKRDSELNMKIPGTGIPSPPTELTLTRRPPLIGQRG